MVVDLWSSVIFLINVTLPFTSGLCWKDLNGLLCNDALWPPSEIMLQNVMSSYRNCIEEKGILINNILRMSPYVNPFQIFFETHCSLMGLENLLRSPARQIPLLLWPISLQIWHQNEGTLQDLQFQLISHLIHTTLKAFAAALQ